MQHPELPVLVWCRFPLLQGAYAPVQGDCSKIQSPGGSVPHCCASNPVFLDMDPPRGADGTIDPLKEPPLKNCCKSGYIGCQAQDPDKSLAAFSVRRGLRSSRVEN